MSFVAIYGLVLLFGFDSSELNEVSADGQLPGHTTPVESSVGTPTQRFSVSGATLILVGDWKRATCIQGQSNLICRIIGPISANFTSIDGEGHFYEISSNQNAICIVTPESQFCDISQSPILD